MTKGKTYCYDDAFKAKARAHQFAFRENELNDFYEEKNPQVILSPEAAKKGLIFCDTYRDLIRNKIGAFKESALCSNMLRSEHIPHNIFTPMEEDYEATTSLLNEILGGGVAKINFIEIEFPGYVPDKSKYLNDGTSFDAFIEYETLDGEKGGVGIEVKYTERGYPIGVKEAKDIEKEGGEYSQMTKKSNYYIPSLNIQSFIKANHLRQIWRNHILGYSMMRHRDIQRFHHIHLYPQGNKHFEKVIPEYRALLTTQGNESFIDLTYESLFDMMEAFFTTEKQQEWLKYLRRRYLF